MTLEFLERGAGDKRQTLLAFKANE